MNIAKNIIESNNFLSIATSNLQGENWIAPVYYCNDDKYNLYFVSSMDSIHVKHILINKEVSVSIFDSLQLEGQANGIQIKGKSKKLNVNYYKNILKLFIKKMNKIVTDEEINQKIQEYKENNRAIFKIKILDLYIQDNAYFKEHHVDKRIRVDICVEQILISEAILN